jgi:pimeloyl-ACP methyl ester carboxylesterase
MNGWLARQMDIWCGHVLASLVYRPGERATTDLQAMQVYRQEKFVSDPACFFDSPPDPPRVSVGELRVKRAFMREHFTFPSAYRPLGEAFAARYDDYTETHTVHGWRYRPFSGHSRATLLFMHGWTEGDYRWEEHTWFPWLCRDCGYTVVALVHPYHGARKPAAARFSGEFFLSADLVRSVEACRQAVIDARSTLTWLLGEAHDPVGISGISLGAFMTYLLLCADGRPAFALPILGHGELLGGHNESATLVKNVLRGIQAQGLDEQTLRPLLRPVTALEMRPRLAPGRILPINGQFDAIVTADKARQLFEAWEIPQVVWLPVGHFGVGYTRAFRGDFRSFVERWIQKDKGLTLAAARSAGEKTKDE